MAGGLPATLDDLCPHCGSPVPHAATSCPVCEAWLAETRRRTSPRQVLIQAGSVLLLSAAAAIVAFAIGYEAGVPEPTTEPIGRVVFGTELGSDLELVGYRSTFVAGRDTLAWRAELLQPPVVGNLDWRLVQVGAEMPTRTGTLQVEDPLLPVVGSAAVPVSDLIHGPGHYVLVVLKDEIVIARGQFEVRAR